MLERAQVLKYSVADYPFVAILEHAVFKVRPLERLHTHWQKTKARRHGVSELSYVDNRALRKLMQDLDDASAFFRVYHRFISEVLSPLFGGRISYSNRPKMRVHLAGTPSVSTFHRDVDITKRPDQINVFLPFTRCTGSNSLYCEAHYGAKDYRPVELHVGEALLFDGGFLEHGSVANKSDLTRCSLDFRFAVIDGPVAAPWSRILSGRPESLGGDPLVAFSRS